MTLISKVLNERVQDVISRRQGSSTKGTREKNSSFLRHPSDLTSSKAASLPLIPLNNQQLKTIGFHRGEAYLVLDLLLFGQAHLLSCLGDLQIIDRLKTIE